MYQVGYMMHKIKIFFKTGGSVDITYNGDMFIDGDEGRITLYNEISLYVVVFT